MDRTTVKIVGIISLVTFIVGILCAALGIIGGVWLMNLTDDQYIINQNSPGFELLASLSVHFGGSILGVICMVLGILAGIYDFVAHAPALIAYIIGKKTQNRTAYWILISVWLCFLCGSSVFILVF